jgi:molybdopterin-guanine dinucleotide biosynthesis protein MobB
MRNLLGVVLAGGEGRRFGGEKALFPLAGRPMAAWALDALKPWTARQVVITNDPGVAGSLGIPARPDLVPGQGPLGGLQTALAWAREEGREGIFLLACDLPLVTGELVGRILRRWPPDAAAAVPGSHGPLGLEPLCGGYAVSGIPALEELLQGGARAMDMALDTLGAHRIPRAELGSRDALAVAFTNVNTREMAQLAEGVLRGRRVPPVVCIIGRKDAGKTELTVALSAELKRRGYRVMTAKHGHGFQMDTPGKDSWRHRHEGGAHRTVLAGPSDFGVIGGWPGEAMPLSELVTRFLWDADIVLAEGFKAAPEPKIEVFRAAKGGTPLFGQDETRSGRTLALVTDQVEMVVPIPLFDLNDQGYLARLADFLVNTFLEPGRETPTMEEGE